MTSLAKAAQSAVLPAVLSAALLAALIASPLRASPVTPIAEAQRGTVVTVAGTVERITDEDEFRLTDATGSIRIYIGPDRVPVAVGERVTVHGVVDDDPSILREIYARSLTRGDGTRITFDHRDE